MRVFCITFSLIAVLSAPANCASKAGNLVRNGGFEHADTHGAPVAWVVSPGVRTVAEPHSGARALLMADRRTAYQVFWWPREGGRYTVAVWAKAQDIRPDSAEPGYGYLALYQFDRDGKFVRAADFAQFTGTSGWKRYTFSFEAAKGARQLSIRTGLFRASGKLWIDDVVLVEGNEAPDFGEIEEYVCPVRGVGKGRIAVFKDDIPVEGRASSPDHLAGLLRRAGYAVTFLDSAALADPDRFSRERFELVVLPYGASFPLPAVDNFLRFLQQGGDFLSTGGYAFDKLLVKKNGKWQEYDRSVSARAGTEMLVNGGFESETKGNWTPTVPGVCAVVPERPHGGRRCALVDNRKGPDAAVWRARVEVEPNKDYVASAWLRTENVEKTETYGFAYYAVYAYDKQDRLVQSRDVIQLTGSNDWSRYDYAFRTKPRTAYVHINAGFYHARGRAWFDDFSLRPLKPEIQLNTHRGEVGDSLKTSPFQVGVFDPSYRLKRVARVKSAPDPAVAALALDREMPAEGYAACGVLGNDTARWSSLLNCYDRYGRLRGSAGSLMRNYNGPFRRSCWAFFGVTSHDLFAPGDAEMEKFFLAAVKGLLEGVCLHNLRTNWAAYDPGEEMHISVNVSNFGWRERELAVEFRVEPVGLYAGRQRPLPIGAAGAGKAVPLEPAGLKVAVGSTESASATFPIPKPAPCDFYIVTATVKDGGCALDMMQTGCVVRSRKVVESGPRWLMRDNYLECDGRRHVMLGTDTYSRMFYSAHCNPLTWLRDTQKCADYGVTVFENLQVNGGRFDPPYKASEEFLRQVDGLVQLCMAHKLVYLPCLHCGHNTAIDDDLMEREAAYSTAYASRYRNVPGIAYYVNGDLRFRLNEMQTARRKWNDFLKRKYGDDSKLREAWRINPPSEKLGNIPVPPRHAKSWADVRARDLHEFSIELVRRWINSQHEACRKGDPDHFTTVEYYKLPWGGIDLRRSMGKLDLANIGYFGYPDEDIAEYPSVFRLSDMRALGKGASVGEFGVKTHPAWSEKEGYTRRTYHVTRTEAQQATLFLAIPHYTLGLGGCKMHNWCWLDADERVFPWGLSYPCDNVEKDALNVYRNCGLLLRCFEMKYEPAPLCLLLPDEHRLGWSAQAVQKAVLAAIDTLIDLHVDFTVLGEADLDRRPPDTRCIIYPVPFSLDDSVWTGLKRFVENGGWLYVSGDISYGPLRRRTKARRLEELAGVDSMKVNYTGIEDYGESRQEIRPTGVLRGLPAYEGCPCIGFSAAAPEIAASSERGPVAVLHQLGKGRVFYTADIPEIVQGRDSDALRRTYAAFLQAAGIAAVAVEPNDPALHVFKLPARDGGCIQVLFNTDTENSLAATIRNGQSRFRLALGPQRPGLAHWDAKGRLTVVEATGDVARNGVETCAGTAHFGLFALDGRDLRESAQVVLLPFGTGDLKLRLAGLAGNPFAAVGEVRRGAWRTYETLNLQKTGDALRIHIDEDRAACIIVIANPDRLADATERLTAMQLSP